MLNRVFYCQSCSSQFNTKSNQPISLPCGDVLCLECIKSLAEDCEEIVCPIDNKQQKINLNSLTTCKAILDHLPREPSEGKKKFTCSNHPSKKVKYFCEKEDSAFCSLCLDSHIKHKITNFIPNEDKFKNELQEITKSIENKLSFFDCHIEKLEKTKFDLQKKYEDDIRNLNETTEKILCEFIDAKIKFQNHMLEKYNKEIGDIDAMLKDLEGFQKKVLILSTEIEKLKIKLQEKTPIVYNDFNNLRRGTVSKWENLIININKEKIFLASQSDVSSHLKEKLEISFDNETMRPYFKFVGDTIRRASTNKENITPKKSIENRRSLMTPSTASQTMKTKRFYFQTNTEAQTPKKMSFIGISNREGHCKNINSNII